MALRRRAPPPGHPRLLSGTMYVAHRNKHATPPPPRRRSSWQCIVRGGSPQHPTAESVPQKPPGKVATGMRAACGPFPPPPPPPPPPPG
eukprot:364176-Chlamydomonas_euryale.AAC.2